jgi:hypothetical protein
MKTYKSSQVFVPGGMPQYTYVSRTERRLEQDLGNAKDNLCKLVTLTGATKSGKTVLANKIFPRSCGEAIWVDGGTIGEENDLWGYILDELGGCEGFENSSQTSKTKSLSGEIEGEVGAFFIKGKGKTATGLTNGSTTSEKRTRVISKRSAAITLLRQSELPLIIDDFHYLKREFQGDVIRALKPLIFEGHPVIFIAIPHRRYDAVKVEREMTGRLESIHVPPWTTEELTEIPRVGFPLLNAELSDALSVRIAQEAYGSPHLMQEFCRSVAKYHEIEETTPNKLRIEKTNTRIFKNVAEGTGKVVFEKLAKGPRTRTDRMQRSLKTGDTADIYKVVLLALAKLSPGMELVDYDQLRGAIREVLADNFPQAHEVSRVLEKMSEIASSDEASTPVIDWEKDDQKLHITDPFFAFFLKWGA